MSSGKKREKRSKPAKTKAIATENPRPQNQTKKRKRLPLGPKQAKSKTIEHKSNGKHKVETETREKLKQESAAEVEAKATASDQLSFFVHQYQSANGINLSCLELEAFNETSIVGLSEDLNQDALSLGEHMKTAFGSLWKEVLSEKHLMEGNIEPGNPALLVISSSALRSLELLRGLRPLTGECQAAKLFSKHMKVEDQVSVLKNRVNIASGTPSRIKKLIDMEAMGLSRLSVVVLDMHTDVKGYSLFTLPQVRDEFWDLYKSYLHQRIIEGNLRICLYGPIPSSAEAKNKKKNNNKVRE